MHFEGTIAGVDDEDVVLTVGRGKQKRIPFRQISRGRLDVDF
jgi:ribosome maturation factor RimP